MPPPDSSIATFTQVKGRCEGNSHLRGRETRHMTPERTGLINQRIRSREWMPHGAYPAARAKPPHQPPFAFNAALRQVTIEAK